MSLFDPPKLSGFDIDMDAVTLANKGISQLRDRLVDELIRAAAYPVT
jgi:hypothetical protein